jgi:hypothetical protein
MRCVKLVFIVMRSCPAVLPQSVVSRSIGSPLDLSARLSNRNTPERAKPTCYPISFRHQEIASPAAPPLGRVGPYWRETR